jgi:hypothetical protein
MYVCIWGGFLTEYSFDGWMGQANCQLNIQLVYAGIQWMIDWIFILCMKGSGGLLTKYSFSVWMVQADCWLNIQLAYAGIRQITDWIFGVCRDPVEYQPNIHSMYAGVRQITNCIFINQARWIGIEYLIVRMIRLSELKLNIQKLECGSELNIQ